jgi:hypothetical protein
MEDPKEFIGNDFGKIILIAGDKNSGKSTFIISQEPKELLYYKPQFKQDKKNFIEELSYIDPNSFIGIETIFPCISQNSDIFLKELALLAKISKHTYLIEWRVETKNISSFLFSTYSKYAKSIFLTNGIKQDTIEEENSSGRFSSIASKINSIGNDFVLEYKILKCDNSLAIDPETKSYNITKWIKKS